MFDFFFGVAVRVLLGLLLSVVFVPLSYAWDGVVTGVSSGDHYKIQHASGKTYNVRLYGVYAPKMAQRYGQEAQAAAEKLLLNRPVSVTEMSVDRDGTSVSTVNVNDQYTAQAFLAGAGLAWVKDSECASEACTRWIQAMNQARGNRHGLWADAHPVEPWKFKGGKTTQKARRKKKKKTVAAPAKAAAPAASAPAAASPASK